MYNAEISNKKATNEYLRFQFVDLCPKNIYFTVVRDVNNRVHE